VESWDAQDCDMGVVRYGVERVVKAWSKMGGWWWSLCGVLVSLCLDKIAVESVLQ